MIRTQLLLPYSLIFILLGRCIVAALVDKLFGAAQAAPKINEPQYSALCVVAKNENKYLREWLEYHRCLGGSTMAAPWHLHSGCSELRLVLALST
jgi:hypothetical protein